MLPTIFLDKKIRYHYDKINKEKIKPNKKGEIQVASDEVFIKCNKKKSFGYYLLNIFFYTLGYAFLTFSYHYLTSSEPSDTFVKIWLISIAAFTSIMTVYYTNEYFFSSKKNIVLDRLNGKITLPATFYYKSRTLKFNHVEAIIKKMGVPDDYGGGDTVLKLYITDKYETFRCLVKSLDTNKHISIKSIPEENDIEAFWVFMVWYMDKNRPLPPGTAFDQYRQRDFERRKAEGFPKPLSISYIKTPEATPKQQKEREKYWKD